MNSTILTLIYGLPALCFSKHTSYLLVDTTSEMSTGRCNRTTLNLQNDVPDMTLTDFFFNKIIPR